MESGQSDIRNKILAPVFKKLRIIEQWGNGLKLIAEELQRYPGIAFDWKEPGLAFRVTFTNINIKLQPELQPELEQESHYGLVLRQLEGRQLNTKELSEKMGQKEISGN